MGSGLLYGQAGAASNAAVSVLASVDHSIDVGRGEQIVHERMPDGAAVVHRNDALDVPGSSEFR